MLNNLTPDKLARIVRWAVLALLAYALWHAVFTPQHNTTRRTAGETPSAVSAKDCDTQGSPFENFKAVVTPLFSTMAANVRVEDTRPGTGEPARCGQHARLRYTYATPSGSVIFNNKDSAETTGDILIGGGAMLPGFEEGLIGMKAGGERTMIIPPNQAFGAVKDFHALRDSEKFKLPKTVGTITAKAWLVALTPATPPVSMEAGVVDNVFGTGKPVQCGEKVTADIAVFKLDGTKVFSTHDGAPVTFTTGRSEVPYGIEQAVLGMNEGGRRTLILPPGFDKPLDPNGGPSALPPDFMLPGHEIAVVEIGVKAGAQEPVAPPKETPLKPVKKKK